MRIQTRVYFGDPEAKSIVYSVHSTVLMFTANVECPHRTWKGSLLMLSMLWTFSSSLDGRQNYLQASCIQRSHTGMATLRLTMQQQPSLLYSVSNDNKDFSIILGVRVPLPCPFYFPCSLARHRPAVKPSSSQPPTLARLRLFSLTSDHLLCPTSDLNFCCKHPFTNHAS